MNSRIKKSLSLDGKSLQNFIFIKNLKCFIKDILFEYNFVLQKLNFRNLK